jgi:hypothetical protein
MIGGRAIPHQMGKGAVKVTGKFRFRQVWMPPALSFCIAFRRTEAWTPRPARRCATYFRPSRFCCKGAASRRRGSPGQPASLIFHGFDFQPPIAAFYRRG